MSFEPKQSHKAYSITLKAPSGNTVGYINLTSQFLKAVTGKQAEMVTVADIEGINDGRFQAYLDILTVEVSEVVPTGKPISASEY